MDYKTVQNNFQRELMVQIILKLKRKEISTSYARRIAQIVVPLKKLPTVEDFFKEITLNYTKSNEIRDAYLTTLKGYEDFVKDERLKEVRTNLWKLTTQ